MMSTQEGGGQKYPKFADKQYISVAAKGGGVDISSFVDVVCGSPHSYSISSQSFYPSGKRSKDNQLQSPSNSLVLGFES